MSVVQYFMRDGLKTFDINQAIRDGQFPDPRHPSEYEGMIVVDRQSGEEATITRITGSEEMYFVHFSSGGWLCLDHAIEQYIPKSKIDDSQ